MEFERDVRIAELRHVLEAEVKIARLVHLLDQLARNHVSVLVLRELGQRVIIVDPVFEHLRGRLDEVPLDVGARFALPVLGAAKHVVEQMAELVEEGLDVAVLHQPSGVIALGHVHHQRADGHCLARNPVTQRHRVCMGVFARARVRIDVYLADKVAGLVDLVGLDVGIPQRGVPLPELDSEHVRR